MDSRKRILALLFLFTTYHATYGECDLSGKLQDKPFPNLFKEGQESYQLSVEYTLPNAKQTDHYVEYYDILNKKGRLDINVAGESSRYYYFYETQEAFEVQTYSCTIKNVTDIPNFVKDFQEEWTYTTPGQADVFGPSALFRHGLSAWNNKDGRMAYMGEINGTVRGLKSQYWRRCRETNLTFDYYFTTDDHEDTYGFKNLKRFPLRVVISGQSSSIGPLFLPQRTEIIAFQPYISGSRDKLQLPRGAGCTRGDLVKKPELPSLTGKNLFLYGEAVYRGQSGAEELWTYSSIFMFAQSVAFNHIAYYYTPWGAKEDKEQKPGLPVYDIFDMNKSYLYRRDLKNNNCAISREKTYFPKYVMPNGEGYLSLNDPAALYTNNELEYIGETTDRGIRVNIFEGVFEDYILGNRTVPKAIVTHYYLQNNEQLNTGEGITTNALTRIRMVFLDPKSTTKRFLGTLTFNIFGFITQVPRPNVIFNIAPCFKNNDDYIWVNFGFPADADVLQTIQTNIPSIQDNILGIVTSANEVTPLRVPTILVDMTDMLYVSVLLIEKPPLQLDYLDEEKGKTLTGTTEVSGIMTNDDCAEKCIKTEGCWGYSICSATCFLGVGDNVKVTDNAKCQLYRRYDNSSYIPSNSKVVSDLRERLRRHEIKLVVTHNHSPVELEASYIEVATAGESDSFEKLGRETNSRLTVKKTGAKLIGDKVKNFGKLRYDECQRICLDFQQCQTLSYCLNNNECILSRNFVDQIPASQMKDDFFCQVLTRKYEDLFENEPGSALSKTAAKVLDLSSEDCARACISEKEFNCLSFDSCSIGKENQCRLHTVHFLYEKSNDSVVTKAISCSHHYKKFSYDFKRKSNTRTVDAGFTVSTGVILEQCAKSCVEYGEGSCFGFDFCEDKTVSASSCILINRNISEVKTAYSEICTQFSRDAAVVLAAKPAAYSYTTAGGIGFLCFVVGCIVGGVIFFLFMYYKMNRSR